MSEKIAAADLHLGDARLLRAIGEMCPCRRSSRCRQAARPPAGVGACGQHGRRLRATTARFSSGSAMVTAWALPADHAAKASPGCSAMALARATTGTPGCDAGRCMPISTSITTRNMRARGARRPRPSSPTFARLSIATMGSAGRRQIDQAAHLDRPDDLVGDQDVPDARLPPRPRASPSLAQVMPMAPAASSLRTISIVFWPLICGRQMTPWWRQSAAMRRDIGLHHVEIDQEGRRVELRLGRADAGRRTRRFGRRSANRLPLRHRHPRRGAASRDCRRDRSRSGSPW